MAFTAEERKMVEGGGKQLHLKIGVVDVHGSEVFGLWSFWRC